jgi:DNA-binding NarL/FixJ family response regulator
VADISDVLHRLVDKSLVVSHPTQAGGMRYGLMEVIRQYAREPLAEAAESRHLAEHARHYALLLERLDTEDDHVRTRAELLGSAYDNVRVAFDWAAEHDHDLEARMVAKARWYWRQCGLVREPLSRTVSVLDKGVPDMEQRLGLSLDAAAWYMQVGDAAGGLALIADVMPLLDQMPDPDRRALLLTRRGSLKFSTGDYKGARLDLREALDIRAAMALSHETVVTLNNLAWVELHADRIHDALAEVDRALDALAVLAARRPPAWQPNLLQTRGAILLALDRTSDARKSFTSGLQLATDYGNQRAAIALLHGLACVMARTGEARTCLELLASAQRCARAVGLSSLPFTGTPSADAERSSRQSLRERDAAEAWSHGMRLDLAGALSRVLNSGPVDQRPSLPPRKAELVRLVAAGLANKEIARRMSISERTVEAHLDQIRQRLGLHNRIEIARWAISTGLVPVD